MLSPEYLLRVSEGGEEIAESLHNDIIKKIVDRIAIRLDRGDNYILTAQDKWQIEVLQEAGYLREDIEEILAQKTGLMQEEIAEAMEDAGVKALEYDDEIYRAAGLAPKALEQSPYLIRLMQRAYEATNGDWVNFTRTMADEVQQSFIKACDKAYMQVASGAMGYSQAFVEAINNIVADGVVVTYPSGHKDTIETATLRCIRTGVSQATAQITDARMDEMEWDTILVSSHLGARVTDKEDFTNHYWWQGKFYSKSGKDERFPPFSVCNMGHVQGIHGANCRHSHGPGDGEFNPYAQYDSEENRKAYETQQRQSTMERRIRDSKRQCMGMKEAADKAKTPESKAKLEAEYQKQAALLQKRNEAYNKFCEDNDLKKRNERITIAKWDRKQAAQARAAARRHEKELEKRENYAKMEEEIRTIGGFAKNAQIHIPSQEIFTKELSFDDKHINKDRDHNVTRRIAEIWIEQSKLSVTVWNGRYERYYGSNGAVYVDWLEKKIRTAYSGLEFDERTLAILEVLEKYGY